MANENLHKVLLTAIPISSVLKYLSTYKEHPKSLLLNDWSI